MAKKQNTQVSISCSEINHKITGMYTRMNNLYDKAILAEDDITFKNLITKLVELDDEVLEFKATIPEEFDYNIRDIDQLHNQICTNIKNLLDLVP